MIPSRRHSLLRLCALAAACMARCPEAYSQDGPYPNRPIKLIVAYPPGGAMDGQARLIAQKWAELLGQSIVVENRPGGNAVIGSQALARSPADGYTIGFLGPGLAINAALMKKLPFDPIKDFEMIGSATSVTTVLVVSPTLNIKTVPEFIAYARAHAGQLNYASPSTMTQLYVELFKQATGTDVVQVPFKGSAEAIRELVAGRVHMSIDGLPAWLPLIKSGRVRALAVTTSSRSPLLPNVPTLDEAGLPGFTITGRTGFLAPSKAPSSIIQKLNSTLNTVLQMPEVRKVFFDQASFAVPSSADEFKGLLAAEIERYNRIVTAAGIPRE